jgi:S-formylglutathione hydrolase FrmB
MASYTLRFLSKNLLRKTEVNLIIPSLDLHGAISEKNVRYYQENDEKFPLIILLSGFGDDNQAWLYQTEIVSLCNEYRIAVAMVGGENKWYLNNNPVDNWSLYLSEELPDFLFGNFSKLDKSKLPIIGGVSMGGYGALYNGLKAPQSFSAIASFSPATKPDDMIDESKHGTLKQLFLENKNKLLPIYLSVGDKDFIYKASREFNDWLTENKIGVNYKFVPNYTHSWDLWRLEIVEFLKWLKNKKLI